MNLAKIIKKHRRKLVETLNEKDEVFKQQHEQMNNSNFNSETQKRNKTCLSTYLQCSSDTDCARLTFVSSYKFFQQHWETKQVSYDHRSSERNLSNCV